MDEFFPLFFKKTDDNVTRGLSSEDSEVILHKFKVITNPRGVPERDHCYKMTLVWDLDQTLISADGLDDEDENDPKTRLVIRPHASEVLEILRRNLNVEFIVWTAGSMSHAQRVVGSFPDVYFNYIICRDSSWYSTKDPVKNLNLLVRESRPMSSIILIDDRMDIGKEHPDNLLIVPPYYPKKQYASNDKTLLYLVNIIQRAITLYTKNSSVSFSTYLFSPLVEKCIEEDNHYFGVKCFNDRQELLDRIKSFQIHM